MHILALGVALPFLLLYIIPMPNSSKTPRLPPDAEAEVGGGSKRGSPYRYLPIKTILRQIDSLQQRITQKGDEFDPSFESRRAGLIAMLTYEYAMQADEDEAPLKLRMDWALRTPALVSMLQSMKMDETTRHPKTEEAVDKELQMRLSNLNKLKQKIAAQPVAATAMEQMLTIVEPAGGSNG